MIYTGVSASTYREKGIQHGPLLLVGRDACGGVYVLEERPRREHYAEGVRNFQEPYLHRLEPGTRAFFTDNFAPCTGGWRGYHPKSTPAFLTAFVEYLEEHPYEGPVPYFFPTRPNRRTGKLDKCYSTCESITRRPLPWSEAEGIGFPKLSGPGNYTY